MAAFLAAHAFLHDLVISTLIGLAVYAVCATVVVLAELSQHRNFAIYRTRGALNDIGYMIFYRCSIYAVLVMPIFAFLSPRLKSLQIGLLANLPPMGSIIAFWIIFDFLNYWTHRLQHMIKPLWAFHSVHHAPAQLTFLTANRIHAVEQLYVGIVMLVPMFILGISQERWVPILFAQTLLETLQHARLNWSFGPMHRLVVSPVFHALHHSSDEAHYNSNYGRAFSIWDVFFGTFVRADNAPRRHGVDGMDVPETLTAQFLHPFRLLLKQRRRSETLGTAS